MSTIEKLDSIQASKKAIKKAITDKGVACDDVLSSYAARIASIPSPKIQDERTVSQANYDFDYISETSYIRPDPGYDAMESVAILNDFWNCNLESNDIPKIASGVSFSFNTHDKENLRGISLFGYKDDITVPVFTANIALNSYRTEYFILYEYSADGSVVEKLWLAKYAYDGQYRITISVLQEIPINSAQ
nr:MAG TPA: hypothetical protein [Caudoviricetes sp.]